MSGINYSLCSPENADGLSTAGWGLAEWGETGDRPHGGGDGGYCVVTELNVRINILKLQKGVSA